MGNTIMRYIGGVILIGSAVNIYFSKDWEAFEIEAVDRGWRNDVYVLIDNILFHLNVYTLERLGQDFKTELEYYGYYTVDSNMILVASSDKETIISTILYLYSQKYFEEIKSESNNDVDKLIKVYYSKRHKFSYIFRSQLQKAQHLQAVYVKIFMSFTITMFRLKSGLLSVSWG